MGARLAGWQVSILGTDIQPARLWPRLRKAKYGEWALRSTSDEIKRGSAFRVTREGWTIRPQYRKPVSFAKLNLADDSRLCWPLTEVGNFDLVLCRNVMIYFAPDLKSRLIRRLRESLTNGGWLIVGAVEHDLENFKCFRAVPAPGATLYQSVDGV